VPNFGEDKEIIANKKSLSIAENKLKHKLDWNRVEKEFEADKAALKEEQKAFKAPTFGPDPEIVGTHKSIKQAETDLNTKFKLDKEYDTFMQSD